MPRCLSGNAAPLRFNLPNSLCLLILQFLWLHCFIFAPVMFPRFDLTVRCPEQCCVLMGQYINEIKKQIYSITFQFLLPPVVTSVSLQKSCVGAGKTHVSPRLPANQPSTSFDQTSCIQQSVLRFTMAFAISNLLVLCVRVCMCACACVSVCLCAVIRYWLVQHSIWSLSFLLLFQTRNLVINGAQTNPQPTVGSYALVPQKLFL